MKGQRTRYRIFLFCVIAILTLLVPFFRFGVFADAPPTSKPDSVLDEFEGDRVMTGTVGNLEVTHDVHVDRILKRQFVRIYELAREKDAILFTKHGYTLHEIKIMPSMS